MTAGQKTKPTKPDKTVLFSSRAEIEKWLDREAQRFLGIPGFNTGIPGMHVILSFEPDWLRSGDGKAIVPTLTAEKAAALVKRAESDPHAYDGACYLAGVQFAIGKVTGTMDCPEALRLFGAGVLMGDLKRPAQKGRRRVGDFPLRLWKYALCQFVFTHSSLPLGRNRSSSGPASFSACDAVAEAFCRAGHNETAAQLESLCYDAAHAELRRMAVPLGLLDYERGVFWVGSTSPVKKNEGALF